jgi:hypothetical protein
MTREFDNLQHAGNGQLTEDTSFTTIFQAIVAEGTGYSGHLPGQNCLGRVDGYRKI